VAGLFGLLGAGAAVFTMKHSGRFRKGFISSRSTGIQALYWAVALPGIFMGILFLFGLAVAAAWFAREQRINEVREGVSRGLQHRAL
jgi:hypothetical protein